MDDNNIYGGFESDEDREIYETFFNKNEESIDENYYNEFLPKENSEESSEDYQSKADQTEDEDYIIKQKKYQDEDKISYEDIDNSDYNAADLNYKNTYDEKEDIKESVSCKCKETHKISVNCNLQVGFDISNKMIYLKPGKSQYFIVDPSKCCGNVIIRYKDKYPDEGICGNLGIYKIIDSGIFVQAYPKLDYKKNDFLKFIAIDECTQESQEFIVVFGYDPCKCC